jgi:hypothetical protein
MTTEENKGKLVRYFNIRMPTTPTVEAKDHFDASMKFFNFHKGIGMIIIQEMNGSEKIGNPLNIRNTFQDHDEEIMKAVINAQRLAYECPREMLDVVDKIKELLLEAKLDDEGKF